MKSPLRMLGLALIGILFGVIGAQAQVIPVPPDVKGRSTESDPTSFTVRSDLVTVLAAVNAQTGQPVLNLRDDEFEILENGVPQSISKVGRQEKVPLRMVVMLDTSSSVRNRLKLEQEAAIDFLRQTLRGEDRAAFYSFNHDVYLRQDLTDSLASLEAATRNLDARGATAIFDAAFIGARRLVNENGRRVIIIVSDGQNTVSKATRERALEEISRSDAVVFGICPLIRTEYDEYIKQPPNDLELLARQTGGRVITVSSAEELVSGFTELAAELRSQYVLSYYSSNDSRDGKFRKIEVRVKRPGVRIRARNGYYAPQD
jgi:Ca-activated chloride channel homolog